MRRTGVVTACRCFFVALAAVVAGVPFGSHAQDGAVLFEAESGSGGTDFATGSDGGVTYITTTNNYTSTTSPDLASRVRTYEVTFPSAGTYNLFGRIRVGPGAFDDDSMFIASSFGTKDPTSQADWVWLNGLATAGYTGDTDLVDGAGTAGSQVWKWLDLTAFGSAASYTVTSGNLTQTFQIGSREDGLQMDKFVLGKVGLPFTVADLDAGTSPVPPPEIGRILVPKILGNGDLSIGYYGMPGGQYAQEWTDSMGTPVMWTSLTTNEADSEGLVVFIKTLSGSREFCRVQDVSQPAAVTNLTASPRPGQVYLNWGAAAFATSYNVKRAASSGGPYTTITNVATTSFLNTGLVNETPYYFVVSALNVHGESADSPEASATPSTNITVIPLVYNVENTGAGYPTPPLPTQANLPIVLPLTDPFMWSATDPYNWSEPTGRSTNFYDWSQRRAEIRAEIEYYEIGYRPPVDPSMIFASVSGSGTSRTLTVRTTNIVNGVVRTLTQTAAIGLPASSGTFPAIIGMNSPNGSISLGGRAIATINYQHNQVTTYGSPANSDPYYTLYAPPYSAPAPYAADININTTGQYSAWSWGVSRLIDGLYKLNGNLGGGVQINLERIGVTGCSYAGKMALFSGALDERIALTIPQESGGGGAPNWRYSYQIEPAGSVEGLAQTDHNWFSEYMFTFANANTAKLPHDHHELLAMVAPRALFATGNPDGATWLSNPSCYVSCKAVERIYDGWGIGDRFGFNIEGGKSHCATTASLNAEIGAFLDKFLLGSTNVNTTDRKLVPSSYSAIDYARWTAWWGTTNPVFIGDAAATYTNTYEPECATVGSAWNILTDAAASNGKYVTVKPGIQSLSSAPAGATNLVVIPFSVDTSGNTFIFARLNCPTADDDSFWVQVDGGSFTMLNGLVTSGWAWVSFGTHNLTTGAHTLTIGYREDGALLDKISVSDYAFSPSGMGPPAAIVCP